MNDGRFYTGTSNIVLPGNKLSFPEKFRRKSRLNYYAFLFNSLEINSSFYTLPLPATFGKWSNEVSADFKFSVKLSRDITHAKDLEYEDFLVTKFLSAAEKLDDKKGCLLVQFPGKLGLTFYNHIEKLLARINSHSDKWRIAIEFRNAEWYIAETFELIDQYNASIVLHDMPKGKNDKLNKNAAFVYYRFHGDRGSYRGSYSKAQLLQYADDIKKFLQKGMDVYAYFNNTIGNAFENARTLQQLISHNS